MSCSSTTAEGGSSIRINKLKDGYTWNVHVVAAGSSLEELREAKEKALLLSSELQAELDQREVDEVEVEVAY